MLYVKSRRSTSEKIVYLSVNTDDQQKTKVELSYNCQYNCWSQTFCKVQKRKLLLCILQQTSSFDCQHFRA